MSLMDFLAISNTCYSKYSPFQNTMEEKLKSLHIRSFSYLISFERVVTNVVHKQSNFLDVIRIEVSFNR